MNILGHHKPKFISCPKILKKSQENDLSTKLFWIRILSISNQSFNFACFATSDRICDQFHFHGKPNDLVYVCALLVQKSCAWIDYETKHERASVVYLSRSTMLMCSFNTFIASEAVSSSNIHDHVHYRKSMEIYWKSF